MSYQMYLISKFVKFKIMNKNCYQTSHQLNLIIKSSTNSISLISRAIQKSNCYHKQGHKDACSDGDTLYLLLFGAAQILVSQITDFHNMEWLSAIAALMSFVYSFIGFGLGFAKVIGNQLILLHCSYDSNIAYKLYLQQYIERYTNQAILWTVMVTCFWKEQISMS